MAPGSSPRGSDGEPARPWGVGPRQRKRKRLIPGTTWARHSPPPPPTAWGGWRSFPDRNHVPSCGAQSKQSSREGPAEGSLGRPVTEGHGGRRAEGVPGAAGEAASRAHSQSGERGGRHQRPDAPKVTVTPRPQGASPTAFPPPPRSTHQKPSTQGAQTPRAQAQHTLWASHTHPGRRMTAATSRASLHRGPGSPERHTQRLASQSLGPGSSPQGLCSEPFQPTAGRPSLTAGVRGAALRGAEGVGKTYKSRAEAPEVRPSLVTSGSPPKPPRGPAQAWWSGPGPRRQVPGHT